MFTVVSLKSDNIGQVCLPLFVDIPHIDTVPNKVPSSEFVESVSALAGLKITYGITADITNFNFD